MSICQYYGPSKEVSTKLQQKNSEAFAWFWENTMSLMLLLSHFFPMLSAWKAGQDLAESLLRSQSKMWVSQAVYGLQTDMCV